MFHFLTVSLITAVASDILAVDLPVTDTSTTESPKWKAMDLLLQDEEECISLMQLRAEQKYAADVQMLASGNASMPLEQQQRIIAIEGGDAVSSLSRRLSWRTFMGPTAIALLLIATFCYCCIYMRCIVTDDGDGPGEEELDVPNVKLDDDTYGFVFCSLITDTHKVETDADNALVRLRYARIASALALSTASIVLQIFFMICLKQFVMRPNTLSLRQSYDTYELTMYGADHCYIASDGYHRGTDDQYFVSANFASMSSTDQGVICSITFGQPFFLMAVLLVWTLTCISEIKATALFFEHTIIRLPTVDSSHEIFEDGSPQSQKVVVGLTLTKKITMIVLLILPRMLVILVLLWMGCRWLAANDNWEKLVIRGIALAFIFRLKDLLYAVLVPARSKQELKMISIKHSSDKQRAGWGPYFEEFIWGLISVAWILMYVYNFQQVLPQFRWDISSVCDPWIREQYQLGPAGVAARGN